MSVNLLKTQSSSSAAYNQVILLFLTSDLPRVVPSNNPLFFLFTDKRKVTLQVPKEEMGSFKSPVKQLTILKKQ